MAPEIFQSGTDWEQSSGPQIDRKVHEEDLWPIDDNANGAKDALEDGLHPVVAIGGRTTADGRPENITGVVKTYNADSTIAVVNVASKAIVRQYVANILTYTPGASAATWEGAPVIGQPVYVDDSDDLGAGVTLSLSALNQDNPGLPNPLAGWLFYCQDEYADYGVGGPTVTSTWHGGLDWDNTQTVEYEVCVMLTNDTGQSWADALQLLIDALQ